jgi:hypothetical protein
LVNDVLGPILLLAKFIESSLKVNVFKFYCYISYLFSYQKKTFPPHRHLNFFNFFLKHTNNNKSDLINHSIPKSLVSTTLAIDIIESTGELEPNKKLFSVHTPFILHDVMVGVFSL